MTHRSNGKRRFPVSEPSSRFATEGESGETWLSKLETGFSDQQEVFIKNASSFIRERPGTSLVLAAAIGGLIGWLIKRRV